MDSGGLGRALKRIYDDMGEAADAVYRRILPGGRLPTSRGGTGTTQGAEPPLGNPASDGQVLSSTTAGVRSWVPQAAAPTTRWDLLTNGDPDAPALIFADGDVIWLEVPL